MLVDVYRNEDQVDYHGAYWVRYFPILLGQTSVFTQVLQFPL